METGSDGYRHIKCVRCGYDQNSYGSSRCEICGHLLKNGNINLKKSAVIVSLGAFLTIVGGWWWYSHTSVVSIRSEPSPSIETPSPAITQIRIGILGEPEKYQNLINHLQNNLGKGYKISISGNSDISYQEAKSKIANYEWDIAFTYSPMLSIVAIDNGYTFAGFRMFPKFEPYYESALFVRADSPINSFEDLTSNTVLALGDFNSASSFYMPLYDLYSNLYNRKMNYPAASGRGIRIKKEQAAHLCIT